MDQLQQPILKFNSVSLGAVAGTTNTFTTATASSASNNGVFTTPLGVLTNSATTPLLDANSGLAFTSLINGAFAGQTAVVVFGVTLQGVLAAVQGPATPTEQGVGAAPGNFILPPQFPPIPDNFVPFAYTVIRTSPTGNLFILGVTSWAAAGITCSTFRNISQVPDRPRIS